MPAIYDFGPGGYGVFLVVTVLMGGVTAFIAGRTLAETWRPPWQVVAYVFPLAFGVRSIHFAVFDGPFLSPRDAIVDGVLLLAATLGGFKSMRRTQMRQNYGMIPMEQPGDGTRAR